MLIYQDFKLILRFRDLTKQVFLSNLETVFTTVH